MLHLLQDTLRNGRQLFLRIGFKRPIDSFEQFRFEFGSVSLNIQRDMRFKGYLLVAIGEDDKLSFAGLCDELPKPRLSFPLRRLLSSRNSKLWRSGKQAAWAN